MQSSKEDNMAFNVTPVSFVKYNRKYSTAKCTDIFEQFAICQQQSQAQLGMNRHTLGSRDDMGLSNESRQTASLRFTWGQLCLGTASHGDSIIHFHTGTALLEDSFAWGQLHMGTALISFTSRQLPTFVLKTLPWWLSKHCTRPA